MKGSFREKWMDRCIIQKKKKKIESCYEKDRKIERKDHTSVSAVTAK